MNLVPLKRTSASKLKKRNDSVKCLHVYKLSCYTRFFVIMKENLPSPCALSYYYDEN